MDFQYVWREKYHYSREDLKRLRASGNCWRYIAAYILSVRRGNCSALSDPRERKGEINDFIDREFGRKDSHHFLCESFPLPLKRHTSKEYKEWYKGCLGDFRGYKAEVKRIRFDGIFELLVRSNEVKLVVSFSEEFNKWLIKNRKEEMIPIDHWCLHKRLYRYFGLRLDRYRHVGVLMTPFFGQGLAYSDLCKSSLRAHQLAAPGQVPGRIGRSY